jgi:hypothetical protein
LKMLNGHSGEFPAPELPVAPTRQEKPPDLTKPAPDPDAAYFARGREILGKNAGGQLAKLKALYGGDVEKARNFLESLAGRDKPAEYLAATIARNSARARGPPPGKEMYDGDNI